MYLLYLDDSGSVKNKNEQYFILGGVCLFERRIHWLTNRIESIAENAFPGNSRAIEFHASEIWSGKKAPWKAFTKFQRKNIIKEVLNTLNDEPETTVVFACAIHKDSFPKQDPVELAFEDLCSRFDMFLKRRYVQTNESHQGLIVLDKSTYETSLQQLSIQFRELGTRWGTIRNINEVPFFVDSRASRLTQLADHIAYAVFRRYQAEDLGYFNCIEGRLDSEEGKLHGLSHKIYDQNCTCPACIQRKS